MDHSAQQTRPTETVVLHSTRPEFCPECGYNLNGLPDQGTCPECGIAYGHEIVLLGWGVGSYATIANRRITPRFKFAIVLYALLVLPALWLGWPGAAFLLLMYAPIGLAAYLRYHALARAAAPVQLRLSSQGYSVRLGCGRPKWQTWESVFALILKEQERGQYFISIHRMPRTVVANKRELRIEIEIQGSVDAMRNIERLRQGPLSYVPCMVRSLRDG
jgi:hypothetical protein